VKDKRVRRPPKQQRREQPAPKPPTHYVSGSKDDWLRDPPARGPQKPKRKPQLLEDRRFQEDPLVAKVKSEYAWFKKANYDIPKANWIRFLGKNGDRWATGAFAIASFLLILLFLEAGTTDGPRVWGPFGDREMVIISVVGFAFGSFCRKQYKQARSEEL